MRPYWQNWSLVFPNQFTVKLVGDPKLMAREIIEQIAYRFQRENTSNVEFSDTLLTFGPSTIHFLARTLGGKVSIDEGEGGLLVESHLVIGILPNLALWLFLPLVPFADNSMLVIVSVALFLIALSVLPIWLTLYFFHARVAESIAVVVQDVDSAEVSMTAEQRRWMANPDCCPACGTRIRQRTSTCPSCDLSLR